MLIEIEVKKGRNNFKTSLIENHELMSNAKNLSYTYLSDVDFALHQFHDVLHILLDRIVPPKCQTKSRYHPSSPQL